MSLEAVRLGGQFWYDTETEQDLANVIKSLSSSHRLGEFISYMFRMAIEDPTILENKDGVAKYGTVTEKLKALGHTDKRRKQLEELADKIFDVKLEADKIYKMCYEMHLLAQINKLTGIEEKADRTMIKEFMLERELKDICSEIGTSAIFYKDMLDREHKKEEDSLTYILKAYGSIIDDLKEQVEKLKNISSSESTDSDVADTNKEVVEQLKESNNQMKELIEAIKNMQLQAVSIGTAQQINEKAEAKEDESTNEEIARQNETENEASKEDDEIDFGDETVNFDNADLGALQSLLGI